MTKLESFKAFLNKNDLTPEIVDAEWPYNYGDNKAYLVTHNDVTQYFFFNDEGVMLQRKVLTTTK